MLGLVSVVLFFYQFNVYREALFIDLFIFPREARLSITIRSFINFQREKILESEHAGREPAKNATLGLHWTISASNARLHRVPAGMSQQSGAASGPPALLRRRHERAQRVRQHAVARVRGEQHRRLVHTSATLQGRAEGRAQLCEPNAVPGRGDRGQHGARRSHQELSVGGSRWVVNVARSVKESGLPRTGAMRD